MATEKKMNESDFEQIVKEVSAFGEVIRSRQDQKQVVIDDFYKEKNRLKAGKISKKALASSVPHIRKELNRLNKDIKKNIKLLKKVADRAKGFAARQDPKHFKVTYSGIVPVTNKKHHKKSSHRNK